MNLTILYPHLEYKILKLKKIIFELKNLYECTQQIIFVEQFEQLSKSLKKNFWIRKEKLKL
mgnify:CR=1 FL=1